MADTLNLPKPRHTAGDFEKWAEVYTDHEVHRIVRDAIAADRAATKAAAPADALEAGRTALAKAAEQFELLFRLEDKLDVAYVADSLRASAGVPTKHDGFDPDHGAAEDAREEVQDELLRDAMRHRYTRMTTTAVRDPESGDRIEVTPEMYDAAIDSAMQADPSFEKGIKTRHLIAARRASSVPAIPGTATIPKPNELE